MVEMQTDTDKQKRESAVGTGALLGCTNMSSGPHKLRNHINGSHKFLPALLIMLMIHRVPSKACSGGNQSLELRPAVILEDVVEHSRFALQVGNLDAVKAPIAARMALALIGGFGAEMRHEGDEFAPPIFAATSALSSKGKSVTGISTNEATDNAGAHKFDNLKHHISAGHLLDFFRYLFVAIIAGFTAVGCQRRWTKQPNVAGQWRAADDVQMRTETLSARPLH